MLTEVMEHFGLKRDIVAVGYYETNHHQQLVKDVRAAILAGRLIAVTGIVGSGKTVMLRRLQQDLAREGKVIVSKSLAVDKERTTIPTLITALFHDLSKEKTPKIPSQGEKRERQLQELVRRARKPVVLFCDEAHDLHAKTLIGLKRLMEVVADGGGMLSVVLVGHPKLRNDLRRPTMEEIGNRSVVFEFDGVANERKPYIRWLLSSCMAEGTVIEEIIEDKALDLLSTRLKTPLQIGQHLSLAFDAAFRIGEKPVTSDIIEAVLSRQLDDLEPRLTRNGYNVKTLAQQFGARQAEIRKLFRGDLHPTRAQELTQRMLADGLPL